MERYAFAVVVLAFLTAIWLNSNQSSSALDRATLALDKIGDSDRGDVAIIKSKSGDLDMEVRIHRTPMESSVQWGSRAFHETKAFKNGFKEK